MLQSTVMKVWVWDRCCPASFPLQKSAIEKQCCAHLCNVPFPCASLFSLNVTSAAVLLFDLSAPQISAPTLGTALLSSPLWALMRGLHSIHSADKTHAQQQVWQPLLSSVPSSRLIFLTEPRSLPAKPSMPHSASRRAASRWDP